MQQMGNSNGSILPSGLSASKSNLVISDPIPGAKPLPVPPELAPFVGVSPCFRKFCGCGGGSPWCQWLASWGALTGRPCQAQALLPPHTHVTSCRQRLSAQENAPVMNGVSGPDSEDYNPWADRKATQPKSTSPPQSQSKLSDSYSNTLPVRKSVAPKNSYATSKRSTGAPGPPGPQQSWHPRGEAGGSLEAHGHACVQHPGDRFEISIPDP